jgi:hypothetical protein
LGNGPQTLSGYTDLEDNKMRIGGFHLLEIPENLLEVLVKLEKDMSDMETD